MARESWTVLLVRAQQLSFRQISILMLMNIILIAWGPQVRNVKERRAFLLLTEFQVICKLVI